MANACSSTLRKILDLGSMLQRFQRPRPEEYYFLLQKLLSLLLKKLASDKPQNLDVGDMRDRLHNTDPDNNPIDRAFYEQARYYFIGHNEGFRREAYQDTSGNSTVGVGFNMDRSTAKEEWQAALGNAVDFDKVKEGVAKLTNEQVRELFNHSVSTREGELRSMYGPLFNDLRANERLAIEDGYFNAPSIIDKSTRFYQHMHDYYSSGDTTHLDKALNELKNHSNRDKIPGIQNRRNREHDMLNSQKSPLYSKPGEPKTTLLKQSQGEAVIPRIPGTEIIDADEINRHPERYFVWRTKRDGRLRSIHQALEGKVDARDNPPSGKLPGEEYGCIC